MCGCTNSVWLKYSYTCAVENLHILRKICKLGHMNLIVTGAVKTQQMVHFSISLLLDIYNLLSQVYVLAKVKPFMPTAFEVTALQSSDNRKIDLYSKH